MARIDDLLYVDDLSRHSDQLVAFARVGTISSPYRTALSTPGFSPLQMASSARGDRSPYIESSKHHLHGFGLKRVLSDYASVDGKGKVLGRNVGSFSSTTVEISSASSSSTSKGISSPQTD